MNQEFKLSVIVPVYNVSKYLDKCVDSLVNQTYSNLEIILVDDGSKDDSGLICDNWANKDSRIKVIHQINGGLSDARNTGINNCTGEFLVLIDSDDYIKNTMLEEMMNCMSDEIDIVCCDYLDVYENTEINYKNNPIEKNEDLIHIYTTNELLTNWYTEKNTIYTVAWNKIYRKKLFENIRYPKGKLHEDEYTTYKLVMKSNKIAVLDKKLYLYLKRENSITASFSENRLHSLGAFKERLDIAKENNMDYFYDKTVVAYLENIIFLYFNFKNSKNEKICNELNKLFKDELRKYNSLVKIESKLKLKFNIFSFNKFAYQIFIKTLDFKNQLVNKS